MTKRFLLCCSLALWGVLPVSAADWPQWRGPERRDHSPDTELLGQWPAAGPRQVWLYRNAGLGYSGYAVVDNRLFTMGARGDQELLIALDAERGTELWTAELGKLYENAWGGGPRGTPTVDGDRVYALGGQGSLICARVADGRVLWRVSLAGDLGGPVQTWGFTESVLVDGDRVLCTPGGEKGTMAALDKLTGQVLWFSPVLTKEAHYSSPIVVEHDGTRQYIRLVMDKVFGVEAATGKLLWESPWSGRTAVIPTPIYHDGYVYLASGYGVGCKLVKLGANQQVTEVYENKVMKNHHGGVVKVGDHLYGYSDGGGWVCQDFLTGEEVWSSKERGKGAVHYADGHLYCVEEDDGRVVLARATPAGWQETGSFVLSPQSENRSSRGKVWTHPVVVNGRLYLRDQENLFCFDVRGR